MNWLHRDEDAPSISPGIARELQRLAPGCAMTWTKYVLSPNTHRPVMYKGYGYVRARGYPTFRFYVRDRFTGKHVLIRQWTTAPDMRHVRELERDRYINFHGDTSNRVSREVEAQNERREKRLASYRDDMAHFVAENKTRIGDSIFEGKHHRRDAKIFSHRYGGSRATPGEVRKDSREDGWTERPQPDLSDPTSPE